VTLLDCGDNSCRSPERSRTGMRTNGGCRCNLEDVAQAHERIAAGLRRLPSYAAQVREAQRGYIWAMQCVAEKAEQMASDIGAAHGREMPVEAAAPLEELAAWAREQAR
jgi:hypothetical protein